MPLATRCPHCATAFRLVRDQLLLSEGWVRCGRCGQAFDAAASQFEFEAPVTATASAAPWQMRSESGAEAGAGAHSGQQPVPPSVPVPATATLVDAAADGAEPGAPPEAPIDGASEGGVQAPAERWLDDLGDFHGVDVVDTPAGDGIDDREPSFLAELADTAWIEAEEPQESGASDAPPDPVLEAATMPAHGLGTDGGALEDAHEDAGARGPGTGLGPTDEAADGRVEPGFVRQARSRERWSRPWVRVLLGALLTLLLLAGLLQAAWIWRDPLAVGWPTLRPVLADLCAATGCRLTPPRRPQDLVIDASSMAPDGPSRLHLEVSLHNRGAQPVAYPWLQLSLGSGGDGDHLLVRKVIAPAEYLRALGLTPQAVRARLDDGLPAAGELRIRLDLALQAGAAGSYTVYLFYP